MHEIIAPLGGFLGDNDIACLRKRIDLVLPSFAEAYIQIDIPRSVNHCHTGAGGIALPGTVLVVIGSHRQLVKRFVVVLVRLVAEEHVLVHRIVDQTFSAMQDNVLQQVACLLTVLGEEIKRLHVYFRQQPLSRPLGSPERVSVMSGEKSHGFLCVCDHELPCLAHRRAPLFQRLHVRLHGVDDRESQRIGLQLKEDLRMPVCQSAVEITFAQVEVQFVLLVRSSSVRAIESNAFYTRRSQLRPLTEVGITRRYIARIDRGVVVLRGGSLVVRTIDIGCMVVQIDTHRKPIESVCTYRMILRIGTGHQLIHLLHRSREISRREGLRILYAEEILAPRQQHRYQYCVNTIFFHF